MDLQKDTKPTVTGGNIWQPKETDKYVIRLTIPTQTPPAPTPKNNWLKETAETIGIFLTLAGIAVSAIIGITTLPQVLKTLHENPSQFAQTLPTENNK